MAVFEGSGSLCLYCMYASYVQTVLSTPCLQVCVATCTFWITFFSIRYRVQNFPASRWNLHSDPPYRFWDDSIWSWEGFWPKMNFETNKGGFSWSVLTFFLFVCLKKMFFQFRSLKLSYFFDVNILTVIGVIFLNFASLKGMLEPYPTVRSKTMKWIPEKKNQNIFAAAS